VVLEYSSSMVGSSTTNPLIRKNQEKVIDLTKYTQFEDSDERYFKNKGGGFAQYYLGPMKMLRLIAEGGPLKIQLADNTKISTQKRFGLEASGIFSKNKGLAIFNKCVKSGKVTRTQLEEMGDSLCACRISSNSSELNFLKSILFNMKKNYAAEGDRRKNTLSLILHFIKKNKTAGLTVEEFREICMYGFNSKGAPIKVKGDLNDELILWRIYETHEYFAFALQALLYIFEREIDKLEGDIETIFQSIKSKAQKSDTSELKFLEKFKGINFGSDCSLDKFIKSIEFSNGDDKNWAKNSVSEFFITNQINEFIEDDNLPAIFLAAIILLIKIHLKTRRGPYFYRNINIAKAKGNEINIDSLNKLIRDNLKKDNSLWVFVKKVLKDFVVDRHTIVALRKFRYEKKSTIRYTMENGIYSRVNSLSYDEPVFTNPRLSPAFRFLEDLGLISKISAGRYVINKSGDDLMEKINEL